jgi:hypothetical protein
MSLRENLFKGGVVGGLLKEREASHPPIQDVIGEVSSGDTGTARHGNSFTEAVMILSRKDSRPFSFLPRGGPPVGRLFYQKRAETQAGLSTHG